MNTLMRILSVGCLFSVYAINGISGTISQVPLFVATQVAPNVFFELDDSGSMDWTVLSKKYWSARTYDPDAADDDNTNNVYRGSDPSESFSTSLISTGNFYSFGMKP